MKRFLSLLFAALIVLGFSTSAKGQSPEPSAASEIPAEAREAIRKGKIAAEQKAWMVAIDYFDQARIAAPDAPAPLLDLGLAEAQIRGRELRAICWLRAFLALAPHYPKAAAVRDQIDRLDVQAEASADELVKLLKTVSTKLTKADRQHILPEFTVDGLSRAAAYHPAIAALGVEPPAGQAARAWCDFVQSDLSEPIFVDYQAALAATAAVPEDRENKSIAVFNHVLRQCNHCIYRLELVRIQWPMFRVIESAADSGNDARAMEQIAEIYEHGCIGEVNLPKSVTKRTDRGSPEAAFWYRKAADAGNALAMRQLGRCYQYGWCIEEDRDQAVNWFRKGADAGDGYCMCQLGNAYDPGHGLLISEDYAQAMDWYRKAADKGDGGAMCSIGYLYEKGNGVAQDFAQAFEWYQKSADKGNYYGMNALANLYESGHGASQDMSRAYEWRTKANATVTMVSPRYSPTLDEP